MPQPSPLAPEAPTHRSSPWILALVVFTVCFAATAIAWNQARMGVATRDRTRLSQFIDRTEASLRARMAAYENILRGCQGFLAAAPTHPSQAQWRAYVGALDLPGRHTGLTSLAFVRPVADSDLQTYLAGIPGPYHRPASDPLPLLEPDPTQEHLILELCEPSEQGRRSVGLDIGVSRTQRLAAERAREKGEPSLSGLIYFSQADPHERAVALFAPVFTGVPQGPESRRQFQGWVSAGVLLEPLLAEVLKPGESGVAFELVDAFSAQGPTVLYRTPNWREGTQSATTRAVDIDGRGWELHYAPTPIFYRTAGHGTPLLILASGASLSFALAALAWALASTRIRALELARQMTGSLHEALARNRSHLAYTPLAVIETDANFRVTEWNPSATRIFGYPREDMLGKDPRLLIPEQGQPDVDLRRASLLSAEEGTRMTLEAVTRTGERILCDWYNTALRDERGHFIGATFLADDITERRRTEQAVRQSQKLESLGVLAGGIAHDFNNLLTAIIGNTEVAQNHDQGNPLLRASLKRIEAAAARGADLASQLLAYAGKGHFSVRPLDLNALIQEMGDLLSVSISKKVSLVLDLQPNLPPVEADSAQFQQVIMNLVINASEAIGEASGTVTLRTRTVEYDAATLASGFPGQVLQPGRFVRLEVNDDGCGMDPETIGRIFDPFFTTKFTGRGLGLSAMLGIVRGHRAGIRVESTPQEGTSFTLLFPASEAAPAAPIKEIAPTSIQTGTILVVDDEAIIRDLAHMALEGAGFQILEARDGLEALEVFQEDGRPIDLVLLDMTMPRMGGAECFRQLRTLAPTTKVLLTSGYTEKESLDSLADLVPDGFLQKPFRVKELLTKVRELLAP